MSDTSIILRFKSVKKYDSPWATLSKVQEILTAKNLKVMTLKPLPYKSPQKKHVEFKVPDSIVEGEGDHLHYYYYYYYMAGDRNPKLETVQKKLAITDDEETETLTALQNKPFKINSQTQEEEKKEGDVHQMCEIQIPKKQTKEDRNNELEILKQQYKDLECTYEILRKRSHEELEGARLEHQETLKKLILEHENELFIVQKQNELLMENAKLQVERMGGDTSVISLENFKLTEDGIALKFNPCSHRIQKADYLKMLHANNNLVHCVVCRESLKGEVEDFYWKEDWALTYLSDTLFQTEIIKANAVPLCTLQQMKKQGKLNEVQELRLFSMAKAEKDPQFYTNVIKRGFLLPKLIFKESEALTIEEKIKLENELPKFPIDQAGKLTMDSALLNGVLQLSPEKSSYFKQKELMVTGAPTWTQTKFPGSQYYTLPMPPRSTHQMMRYLFSLRDPELNPDIIASLRNPENMRNFQLRSSSSESDWVILE